MKHQRPPTLAEFIARLTPGFVLPTGVVLACECCDTHFVAARNDARFCSNACRVKAQRQRLTKTRA